MWDDNAQRCPLLPNTDHYTGLSEHWKEPVYCSEVTGQLVVHICGVKPELIRPLPLDKPVQVLGEHEEL